jgi:cytochrome c553
MPILRHSVLILISISLVVAQARQSRSDDTEYRTDIYPILENHCIGCHGADQQEGNLRLDNLSVAFLEDRAAAEHWHEVLNALQKGEMPPREEPQLSSDQLARITAWLTRSLKLAAEAQRTTEGRTILRRLNRVEYQNTMYDLLDLEMDYARDLPPDALSEDGFQNNGEALQMSSLQLEYYLATARRALDRVIVQGDQPPAFDHSFPESNLDDWLGDAQRSNQLGRKQDFLARMVDAYPEEGDFLVRVQLTANLKPNVGFPLLEVSVGYRPDTELLMQEFPLVEITKADAQTFEFRGRLENFPLPVRGQSKYPGLVVRIRNVYDDKSPLPKEEKDANGKRMYPVEEQLPTIHIRAVEFHGNAYTQWPPQRHQEILFDPMGPDREDPKHVAEVLKRFMTRAFRRPVSEEEVSRFVAFHQSIRPEFPSFEETIRETLAMVLIQPDFLFLMEPAGEDKRSLNEFELASRLSYFLWSSCPDESLIRLASEGKLRETLPQEIERLLNDPRAEQFTQQFTDQWLHLNLVSNVAVNATRYPGVDANLKEEMCRETRQLFSEVLKDNLSALQLISSDFTMLNEPLAKHYGVGEIFGRSFRRVALPS